ncbi:MAG: hypothetical protein N4A44_03180 [Alphaproteobacteria bacterium]|jgi:hypothetical protein|nr:hypothetical protein [Alphaproteobacteria bacterium]
MKTFLFESDAIKTVAELIAETFLMSDYNLQLVARDAILNKTEISSLSELQELIISNLNVVFDRYEFDIVHEDMLTIIFSAIHPVDEKKDGFIGKEAKSAIYTFLTRGAWEERDFKSYEKTFHSLVDIIWGESYLNYLLEIVNSQSTAEVEM